MQVISLSFCLSITTVGLQGFIFPDQSSNVLIPAQLTSNFRPNPSQARLSTKWVKNVNQNLTQELLRSVPGAESPV